VSDPADWLPLRFRDFDAFGHVYHAEYLTLLDEARTGWFAALLGLEDPSGYVVAHLEIDYLSSLSRREDDAVRGEFTVERVGASSLTLGETLLARDGRVVTRGRSVVVLRDVAAGVSRALTPDERTRVTGLLPEGERTDES
jgi:acyl-CoA thioester hydrolase